MAWHNDLGFQGEELAVGFLKKKGYKILERNWKLGNYEVDIICKTRSQIIFVEVKTRANDLYGQPEDAVDLRRQKRLTNAADAYIRYTKTDLEPRFDIISIILNNGNPIINHIEDAFLPIPHYY